MTVGLIIGKFYPPHAGHHVFIRTAAAQVDRLVVVAMSSAAETIPLADRVGWLGEEHADTPGVVVTGIRCDAPLDLGDQQVWAAQLAAMRAALRQVGEEGVDVVLTGESYGERLAQLFGARWVQIERPGPWSGTLVRADLQASWDLLAPPTRAGLVMRVVLLGAESTGTTTVSQSLAAHYRQRWPQTRWVAEYGREYTTSKWHDDCVDARQAGLPEPDLATLTWGRADFDAVAAEQARRENEAARSGSPVLVCDTDAVATAVWECRYLRPDHRRDPGYRQVDGRRIYLVTDHVEVPWHDDGLREGDLDVRAAMTGWFTDALTAAGLSWVLLTGSLEQRTRLAIRTVDQLLDVQRRFGEPYHGPGFG